MLTLFFWNIHPRGNTLPQDWQGCSVLPGQSNKFEAGLQNPPAWIGLSTDAGRFRKPESISIDLVLRTEQPCQDWGSCETCLAGGPQGAQVEFQSPRSLCAPLACGPLARATSQMLVQFRLWRAPLRGNCRIILRQSP
ncbi:MAG: hypothetical protein ISS57_01980 [Anaerolineales bacterium]|nr:hypothetical protein [Anaerolineales bacterium]